MLRRSKTLSIVMSLCLCLAMLAPVFVAPQAAEAASTYDVQKAPVLDPEMTDANLGQVMVEVPMVESVNGDVVTVSLPSDLDVTGSVYVVSSAPASTDKGIYIYVPDTVAGENNGFKNATFNVDGTNLTAGAAPATGIGNSFDLKINLAGGATGEGRFTLYFNGVDLNNYNGDVNLDFSAPSNSGYTTTSVVIAKSSDEGNTTTVIKSVKSVTAGSDKAIDEMDITESAPGTLKAGDTIKAKILTDGVTWNAAKPSVTLGWGFSGTIPASDITINDETMEIKLPSNLNANEAGKIAIIGASLDIDETEAEVGDIEVNIKGADMTEAEFVAAKYVDYGVTVSDKTSEELTAGDVDQEIGEFTITEGAPGSLVEGRTVTLTLPDGLKWKHETDSNNTLDYTASNIKIDDGDSLTPFEDFKVNNSGNERVLTMTVASTSTTEGRTIRFKDMELDVKPSFTGPIEITVAGSAGAEGTVNVGEVKPAVELTANSVSDIVMGGASQKVADIVITETKGGAIFDDANQDVIVLALDDGYKFAQKPSYKIDGDLKIDSTKLQNNDTELKITIDSDSAKASTITLSDVYVTAFRYVPEGPVKATLLAAEDSDGNITGSTALDKTNSDKSAGDVVIANCVTPAEGASSQFKIGSNVYTVNGVAKIMDVAPYIKDSRTYVPVRYLGYALGVAESDVVWDAATSKVTITKGDKVVELTIGSTTITVNGEAQTMDVAPEIANSRTMLPARFVAEGLGATVGWDAASNTVYVQQ